MKLKQLFCRHIWKDVDKTYLRSYKVFYTNIWGYDISYDTKEYSFNQTCMKCNKTRIIVKEEITK